ncbi:hypothetical protein FS837_007095 [Tulasnella sp. UAMH 9824]|nr:hypothetical protein FS837_007095 [Tulasnella sp. UAMH 9824]
METISIVNQSSVLNTDLPDEILLVIFWQLLWSFDENDENTPFNELAEWHYACLAYLSGTSILPEQLRAKILRLSGSLPLDITYDHDSDVKGVYSPTMDGFVPQDMMNAFPRWKAATLRFERAEYVPPEIYNRSRHQLQALELSVDDGWDGTQRGLLGGNTETLRHLRLVDAEFHFPTSPLASLRTLYVDGMFGPFLRPIQILEALRTTRMLRRLTLCFQSFGLRNIPAWSAERSQRIDTVDLPELRLLHLEVEVDVGIFLLRHISGTSCNHLDLSFSCGGKLSPITELRQTLTGLVPCIRKAIQASSHPAVSVALSDINGQTIVLRTDQDTSHTFLLTLSYASKWLVEVFQWLGDLVSPFSQDNRFVSIYWMTHQIRPTVSSRLTPSELDRWIQATAFTWSVHTLDLGRFRHEHCGILEPLSKPIDERGWPLASLKRLVMREENDRPLQVLDFLKARSGKNPASSHPSRPVQLAELVLLVEGKSHSEEWVEYISAIEEALFPGRLIVEYSNDGVW